MARIGIGVPVYNGAGMLADSLECLRTQSFEDFEVVIGDNASDDATSEICADFAARDSRFRHLRRAENIGSLKNFQDLRARSDAELFCWRAYDDLSATDFLERLVGLFDADPATRLAVCEVRTSVDDRARLRIRQFRAPPARPRIARITHQLISSHASWIYGLWHRETLGALQDRVHADYPYAWAWDHLTLLPVILDGTVRGTNGTHFVQRIFRSGLTKAERRARQPSPADLHRLRGHFDEVARAIVAERDWGFVERGVLSAVLPFYVDKRAYRRSKLIRGELMLQAGGGKDSVWLQVQPAQRHSGFDVRNINAFTRRALRRHLRRDRLVLCRQFVRS